MPCEDLRNEVEALKQERVGWQTELQTVSPSQKPFIVSQIRQLTRQIGIKGQELNQCLLANNLQPLSTTFVGTTTLTTSYPSAPGLFINQVTLGIYFEPGRRDVVITSFPLITTDPFSTPLGTNVTTVKQVGAGKGSFDHSSGMMGIGITLLFDHSVDLPFYEEDSTLPLLLGTGSIGSLQGTPLNPATRSLRLVGMGTFQGGILGGSIGTMVITGTLTDQP